MTTVRSSTKGSSVKNGVMRAEFIVPKDIAYENRNGRISIYFSNSSMDGKGYTRDFIVGGSSSTVQKDSRFNDHDLFGQ